MANVTGVDDFLRCGAIHPDLPTERIDTHAATIVLNGDRAWKMKQPVRFRYLDFSTVEQRHAALAAELRLNRRTAPDLYLGLHSVRVGPDGSVSLDGPGRAQDWVLEMRRFDDDALLSRVADAGRLDDGLLQQLAARVAALHDTAEVCDDPAGTARLQKVVDGNLGSMSAFPEILEPARAGELTERLTEMIATHTTLLDERARSGRVRHGHGDLHLANIAIIDDVPVPFDCLEFDAEMATTDVMYDLAFLVMDLWARGLRHEANVVVNTYLDLSPADEHAFVLLPLMIGVRATVRAHVCAAEGKADRANDYLSLALSLTHPVPARLYAIGGGSGTGKSTVARAIGGDIGRAPGARILRSDVLRKQLAGVGITTHLPSSGYTPEMSAHVYGEINRLAAVYLSSGMSVIADAVFGRDGDRRGLEDVAERSGVPFVGVWLELSEAERIARIERRGPDASDADAAVAQAQSTTLDPPDGWLHLNAAGDVVGTLQSPIE